MNASASPQEIRVKVCGITRPEDARALDTLSVNGRGIDYLGFNFWPGSKRYIAPEAAAPLIAALRHATPVGIFVDHTAEEINRIAALTGIKMAQLHGAEGWDILNEVDLPVIKAVPHTGLNDWGGLRPAWAEHPARPPEYFLVDTATASAFGGTGAAFDWNLLGTGGDDALPRPFFLAGGLGPHNVAEAVAATRRFGLHAVDLNSKVETPPGAPGVKDIAAVEACLRVLTAFVDTVDTGRGAMPPAP